MNVLLVLPNLQLATLIPSNIGLLTACLKTAGFNVKLFDTTFYKIKEKSADEIRVEMGHYKSALKVDYIESNVFDDFKNIVDDFNPEVIGFSVVDATYPLATRLLNHIKPQNEAHIVFGGITPTLNPEFVIGTKYVDSICIGEGEGAIVELCEHIRDHKNIINIQNLWINFGDLYHANPCRPLTDINTMPYEDFDVFDNRRFLRPIQGRDMRLLPLMIDRGCPNSCKFCAAPALRKFSREHNLGTNFRVRSIESTKDYVRYMVNKYKPEIIYFNSETFFARPEKHIQEFADFYKNFINIPYNCMTRIETINETNVRILSETGCSRLVIGIEHANEKFRVKMNKTYTNEQAKHAFNILNNYKIPLTLLNMVGFPDETPELAQETVMFNAELTKNYSSDVTHSISIFQPYYGTEFRKECIQKGYITEDSQASGLIEGSILNMPNFTKEQIYNAAKDFVKNINELKSHV